MTFVKALKMFCLNIKLATNKLLHRLKRNAAEHYVPMTKEEAKKKIQSIVRKVEKMIPLTYVENLPPIDTKNPDIPQWHDFEDEIWIKGSNIDQILIWQWENHMLFKRELKEHKGLHIKRHMKMEN